MNFTINKQTNLLVLIAFALKAALMCIYSLPIGIDPLSGLLLGVINFLATVYMLFWLKNFVNQIMEDQSLNLPITAWIIIAFITQLIDAFYYYTESNKSNYEGIITGIAFLIMWIFLVIRLYSMRDNPFKYYMRLLAWLIILNVITPFATPLILAFVVQPEFNYVIIMNFIIDAARLLPFVALCILAAQNKQVLSANQFHAGDPIR